MTELPYLKDAYAKEFEATILKAEGNKIVLDSTLFFPTGGGQPNDLGYLTKENQVFNVVNASKVNGDVIHELDKPGLKEGDKIKGFIDWKRRYKLMRSHTAMHVISTIFNTETSALITGNQIDIDKSRIDFDFEAFDMELINKCFKDANEVIKKDHKVKSYFIPKEQALSDESLIKLATRSFLEKLNDIRIVEIENFDKQLDGGTHVNSLKEIGEVELIKCENKGKGRKRLYFKLKE